MNHDSSSQHTKKHRGFFKISMAFLSLMFCSWPFMAIGQEPVHTPMEQNRHTFDIPPQGLSSGLARFSETTNLELLVDSALTKGVNTQGVSGERTSEEALRTILVGTGLTYRFVDPKTVTLERDSAGAMVPAVIGAGTAGAVAGAAISGSSDTSSTVQNGPKPVKVPEILVKDVKERATATIGNLPEEYAGGQVAEGSSVGMLGQKNIFDTPFNTKAYTERLIREQQARSMADVVDNDPSIRNISARNSSVDDFFMRGFRLSTGDSTYDGLYGLVPFRRFGLESIERVEVIKGPNALLTGLNPAGRIAGVINLVPKRATDAPLTRLTGNYVSDSNFGGHADIGRRFGDNNAFGVRFNGAVRGGDLPVNNPVSTSEFYGSSSLALDYRSDRFRATVDFNYQHNRLTAPQTNLTIAPGIEIPSAPRGNTNFSQPWSYFDSTLAAGLVAVEYDFIPNALTGSLRYGHTEYNEETFTQGYQIADGAGTLSPTGIVYFPVTNHFNVGEAAVKSKFTTGPIDHALNVTGTFYRLNQGFNFGFAGGVGTSNLYNPVLTPNQNVSDFGFPTNIPQTSIEQFSGVAVADTVSFFEKRIQLTGGVRYQNILIQNFDSTNGAKTSEYDSGRFSPAVGLVVKPIETVSIYANFIQGLTPGPTAPTTAVNANQVFAPMATEQYEAGAKWNLGRFGVTASLFQITQPSAFVNPATNVFGIDGKQRNRGFELETFGEPLKGLRVLGGAAFIDGIQTQTAGGTNDGKLAPGVSSTLLNLTVDADVPGVRGLALWARGIYTSSAYYDANNTQAIPNWWRGDLGARYSFNVHETPLTLLGQIQNISDNAYWAAAAQSQLALGAPRTFLLSLQADF